MKQILKLKATLNPNTKDYFKPIKSGKLKGFKRMPIFSNFTNENLNDFSFYAKYDPEDSPKFVLKCEHKKSSRTQFIPIDPEVIYELSSGRKMLVDNIILECHLEHSIATPLEKL